MGDRSCMCPECVFEHLNRMVFMACLKNGGELRAPLDPPEGLGATDRFTMAVEGNEVVAKLITEEQFKALMESPGAGAAH